MDRIEKRTKIKRVHKKSSENNLKRKEMELKRKLFKMNGSLDSILSPMNLDLLLPSLLCFSSQEHLPRMLNPCWSSFFLRCFHFLFLLRRKSATLGFNIKLQLFKLNLWSPSWSGTLLAWYRSFFTNQMTLTYCDLDYPRMIRTSFSCLYENRKIVIWPSTLSKAQFFIRV